MLELRIAAHERRAETGGATLSLSHHMAINSTINEAIKTINNTINGAINKPINGAINSALICLL